MGTQKQYFPEVDVVKGIAILLVILGHSFCSYPLDLGSQFPKLGYVVRSFQMPLFFIASGFLFSTKGSFREFMSKKARRIVVPFLVFSLLSVGLKFTFSSFTRSGEIDMAVSLYGIVQGHSYWFLYSLMWFMVVAWLIKRIDILIMLSMVSIVACLTTDIESETTFTIGRSVYYFPFFCIGYCLRPLYGKLTVNGSWSQFWVIALLGALYVISVLYKGDNEIVALYAVTLSGSLMTWEVTRWMALRWDCLALKHFGHYSLQYYLNHLLIMLPIYYFASRVISTPPICNY